ncbi:hypothetical protein G7Y89_g2021 [Cudoniella acicularis]|uniref:Uncharacterized protein n=1 Tax=Cudoniella acicularis TaxID=354080 RepID=A0A8H4RV91_9HELO|nr:hypothetical protein G7Y89_g2021 [Cudoniella acicularis]
MCTNPNKSHFPSYVSQLLESLSTKPTNLSPFKNTQHRLRPTRRLRFRPERRRLTKSHGRRLFPRNMHPHKNAIFYDANKCAVPDTVKETVEGSLIRYVAWNRLRNSPPLTFLSLPREIRDKIYDLALVSASPIIIWKGSWKCEFHYLPKLKGEVWPGLKRFSSAIHWRSIDQEAISASLRLRDVNLILCNKTVSYEAALVLYAKNTFSFLGEHNWDPIASWLETIGAANPNSLVSMEINAYRPDPVWQRSSGERLGDPGGFTREEIYPRHPYLHLRTCEKPLRHGQVDNINPAVETIFILLGQKTSAQKVTIVMQLPTCIYPGARTPRHRFDIRPQGGLRVEVLWKGEECRQELEDQQAIIESIGWDINVLPAKEDELHPNPEEHGCHPTTDEWRIAKYILRRKELTGPLWAQDPCPYHDISPEFIQNYL